MELPATVPKRRWKGWVIFGTFLLIAAAVLVWIYLHPRGYDEATVSPSVTEPLPVSLRSNSLFFGNAYWGRYINDWSMASDLKTAYPFSRLNEFGRENYDSWIAGLECPTVAGLSLTSYQEDTTLSFNCNPDYLPEAAKWFTAFTLANNHTDNQGAEGFAETRQHLEENKIQYFGHYDPTLRSDACEVLAYPVTVTYDDDSTKQQTLPVALCAFHGVFQIPPADSIAVIAEYAQYMPVIAMPHMGAEYKASADELKQSVYRSMIDQGADMVLGDHPHWIQNSEAYKGRPIVYSMGNFIFDQQDTAEVVRSAAIRVLMQTDGVESQQLKDWLALGESCRSFQDTCLSQAREKNLRKLTVNYQFGVVGTNDSNKIVKPATADQQASILQRLNWEATLAGLEAPYSGIKE